MKIIYISEIDFQYAHLKGKKPNNRLRENKKCPRKIGNKNRDLYSSQGKYPTIKTTMGPMKLIIFFLSPGCVQIYYPSPLYSRRPYTL